MLWDFMIQCDHYIECRKPDIVVVEKEEHKILLDDYKVRPELNKHKNI